MVREINTGGRDDFFASQGHGPGPDTQLAAVTECMRQWTLEWLQSGGHQERLYSAWRDVQICKEFAKDRYETEYAGDKTAPSFDEAYKAKYDELFPPPKETTEEMDGKLTALEDKIFGEGGFQDAMMDQLKARDNMVKELMDGITDLTASVETLGVKEKKRESMLPPDLPPKFPKDEDEPKAKEGQAAKDIEDADKGTLAENLVIPARAKKQDSMKPPDLPPKLPADEKPEEAGDETKGGIEPKGMEAGVEVFSKSESNQ